MSQLSRIRRKSKIRYFNPANVDRQKALQGLRLASFGRRAAAFAIDFGLVAVFLGLLKLPETLKHRAATGGFIMDINPFHGWELLSLLIYFGLWTYFGRGQTLGKKLMKIRIVSLTHEHLTLWHSIERSLGYGASISGGRFRLPAVLHPSEQTDRSRQDRRDHCHRRRDIGSPAVSLEHDTMKSSL